MLTGMRVIAVFVFTVVATAAFAHPGSSIAVAANGRVVYVDTGRGVFVIERDGNVTRHEGQAFHWFAFDPAKRFARTPWPSIPGAEFQSAGDVVLSSDFPVAIGGDGAFYFPRFSGQLRMMRIAPDGASSVHATLPGSLQWLNGLAAGPGNTLYYTEDGAIRKIDARGAVSTVVENVSVADCSANPQTERPPNLRGLAVAPDGTIYVAASGCGALLKIDTRGNVSKVLWMNSPWSPTAVAVANGELYVLEYLHTPGDNRREWIPRVRKIQRNGTQVMLTK